MTTLTNYNTVNGICNEVNQNIKSEKFGQILNTESIIHMGLGIIGASYQIYLLLCL